MFTTDFQNYFYELAEKDYAMQNPCRDNMPDEYYHAYSALYWQGECDANSCRQTPEEAEITINPLTYVLR